MVLASVAQFVGKSSHTPKGYTQVSHSTPTWAMYGRQTIDVSHVDVSLSLPLINKNVSSKDFKRKDSYEEPYSHYTCSFI